jgi:hypothetical protein
LSGAANGLNLVYIRIIRDKSSGIKPLKVCLPDYEGQSKGLALIKFPSIDDAAAFLGAFPTFALPETTCWLDFGVEPHTDDWYCKTCNTLNYHWRTSCFKCQASKGSLHRPSQLNDGSQDICEGPIPTKFLLIRGLDESVNGTELFERCSEMFKCQRVWLARDSQTYKARSFAFVEFSSEAVESNLVIFGFTHGHLGGESCICEAISGWDSGELESGYGKGFACSQSNIPSEFHLQSPVLGSAHLPCPLPETRRNHPRRQLQSRNIWCECSGESCRRGCEQRFGAALDSAPI